MLSFALRSSYILAGRCDSIEKLKERLRASINELSEPNAFKDFYNFVFTYAKGEKKSLGITNSFVILSTFFYSLLNNLNMRVRE